MSKIKLIVTLGLGWLATLVLGIIIGAGVMYKNYTFWDIKANQDDIIMEIEKIKKDREWVDFVRKSLEGLIEAMEADDVNLERIKWWNRQMLEIDKKLDKEDKKSTAKKDLSDFKGGHEYKNK